MLFVAPNDAALHLARLANRHRRRRQAGSVVVESVEWRR
jgi:hypothetical protein